MVKGPTPGPATGPGIYSATYSNIPVYEFQFGADLKEHVMRRRSDDWINATHILKAVGFDKPARTRILERDVQKLPQFEKIQGGYGKYQGTWIPLQAGADLARRNNVYDKLSPIFEFRPGNDSPPPAPKHTTNKPKAPKKPAVPKFTTSAPTQRDTSYDNVNDDETPDDTTVASQSYLGDHDDYTVPPSQQSTGHRKRKRNAEEPTATSYTAQEHTLYADELLDYFMISKPNGSGALAHPNPPPNFHPDWPIDTEENTALSWACAMGDVDVMKELRRRFHADISLRNIRGETSFMRAVLFVNCFEKKTFPVIAKELFPTVHLTDECGSTVIHHAAALTHSKQKHGVARYYLDVILNKLTELCDPEEVQRLINARDIEGNTACHIAAENKARKCLRALIGRGAATDIANHNGVIVEDIIQMLNRTRRDASDRYPQASSSPYALQRNEFPQPSMHATQASRPPVPHHSEAAMTVESKIAPVMMEKFKDLSKSFDDELLDLDNSEKEARRILKATEDEVRIVRDQIKSMLDRDQEEEDLNDDTADNALLEQEEALVLSILEQQQAHTLHLLTQSEDSRAAATMNGNGTHSSQQDPEQQRAEKNHFARRLAQLMNERKGLMQDYAAAKASEGGAENVEKYKALILLALGMDKSMSHAELEVHLIPLLEVYMNEKADGTRETEINGDGGI